MTITIPTSAYMKYNLWHYVIKLLRLRITITISGFRRAKLRRKIGTIILALFLLAIFILVFIGSWKLLGVIRSPAFAQSISGIGSLLDSIPILILAGAFLGILLTSFGLLLQALYLAGDMDFLLSAPVPISGCIHHQTITSDPAEFWIDRSARIANSLWNRCRWSISSNLLSTCINYYDLSGASCCWPIQPVGDGYRAHFPRPPCG